MIQHTITYNGVNPLIAIKSDYPMAVIESGKSGATTYWSIGTPGSTARSFDYWIFDDVPAAAPSGMGLLVRNAAGDIVFNSQHKYLRIEDQIHVAGPAATHSYTPGQDYAVIFAGRGLRAVSADIGGGSWSTDKYAGTAAVNAEDIDTAQSLYATVTTGADETYTPLMTLLVVDVTNY